MEEEEEEWGSKADSTEWADDYDKNLEVYSDDEYAENGSSSFYSNESRTLGSDEDHSSNGGEMSELSESGSTSDVQLESSRSRTPDANKLSNSSLSLGKVGEEEESVNSSAADSRSSGHESDMTGQLSLIPEDEIYDDSLDGRDSSG